MRSSVAVRSELSTSGPMGIQFLVAPDQCRRRGASDSFFNATAISEVEIRALSVHIVVSWAN
jgi:hypothetical protein